MSYKLTDEIMVLETNIDDCSGEIMGYVMDKLFENGARDVFYTPIHMKKNRPAYMLTVLCKEETADRLEDIIFSETTSIGIRKRRETRVILKREKKEVETPYGRVEVKAVETEAGERYYPEFESAKKAARENKVPLKEVLKHIQ